MTYILLLVFVVIDEVFSEFLDASRKVSKDAFDALDWLPGIPDVSLACVVTRSNKLNEKNFGNVLFTKKSACLKNKYNNVNKLNISK